MTTRRYPAALALALALAVLAAPAQAAAEPVDKARLAVIDGDSVMVDEVGAPWRMLARLPERAVPSPMIGLDSGRT